MILSKPHPLIALFADIIFFSFVLVSLISTIEMALELDGLRYSLRWLVLFVLFLPPIYYHTRLNKLTHWLSPGERLAGRALLDDKKVWTNPYTKNRFFLFTVIFLSLLFPGRDFGMGDNLLGSICSVANLIILSLGAVFAGARKRGWGFLLATPAIIWLFFADYNPPLIFHLWDYYSIWLPLIYVVIISLIIIADIIYNPKAKPAKLLFLILPLYFLSWLFQEKTMYYGIITNTLDNDKFKLAIQISDDSFSDYKATRVFLLNNSNQHLNNCTLKLSDIDKFKISELDWPFFNIPEKTEISAGEMLDVTFDHDTNGSLNYFVSSVSLICDHETISWTVDRDNSRVFRRPKGYRSYMDPDWVFEGR